MAATINELSSDPSNASKLNNIAVFLFMLGVSNEYGASIDRIGNASLAEYDHLQRAAMALLDEGTRVFANHRPIHLNLAYFTSLRPSSLVSPKTEQYTRATSRVSKWITDHPDDITARILLGSLQAQLTESDDHMSAVEQTLRPLVENADTTALGWTLIGDGYLMAAERQRERAPYAARAVARRALDSYDRALATTIDPGVYAGRSKSLSILGANLEAIEAQQEALRRDPKSMTLMLELALLYERAGNARQMRKYAREALTLGLESWNPSLATVRLDQGGERGPFSLSYGSSRDYAIVRWSLGGGFAGGYTLSLDIIPQVEGENGRAEPLPIYPPDFAVEVAVRASVVLAESGEAESDANRWWESVLADPRLRLSSAFGSPRNRVDRLMLEILPAAYLSEGKALPPTVEPFSAIRQAEYAFRRSRKFAEAAAVCKRAQVMATSEQLVVQVLQCWGETSYLAGDYQVAARQLAQALRQSSRRDTKDGPSEKSRTLRLRAAAAAQAARDFDSAERLYGEVISDQRVVDFARPALFDSIEARSKLGEIALQNGDHHKAVLNYDLALSTVASMAPGLRATVFVGRIAQQAHNNRGLARLRIAQRAIGERPDCSQVRHQFCLSAQDDFTLALGFDPANYVYILNAGWAARLLGDDGAARALLVRAVETDPSAFPVHNDLGVMAAEAGDLTAARHAFMSALAAEPNYDLAAWNLGILELKRGLRGIPRGEAFLARATRQTPSLLTEKPQYKTDERIYSVRTRSSAESLSDWTFSRSYGIAGASTGGVVVLVTVLSILRAVASNKAQDVITAKGAIRISRGATFLSAAAARLFPTSRLGRLSEPWLVWPLTIVILLFVVMWPASRPVPEIALANVGRAAIAVLVALVAHEFGHLMAASGSKARIVPTCWFSGAVLAVILLPVGLSSGPFLGHRIDGTTSARAWLISWAGPLANIILAVMSYCTSLIEPMPILRYIAAAQLAVAGYTMLPFQPLDGATLVARRPGLLFLAGMVVTAGSILLATGLL